MHIFLDLSIVMLLCTYIISLHTKPSTANIYPNKKISVSTKMRPTTATNLIPCLKWTIFLLKLVGGFQKQQNFFGYFSIFSLCFIVFQMQLDMILNYSGVETLKRIMNMPSLFLVWKINKTLFNFKYYIVFHRQQQNVFLWFTTQKI